MSWWPFGGRAAWHVIAGRGGVATALVLGVMAAVLVLAGSLSPAVRTGPLASDRGAAGGDGSQRPGATPGATARSTGESGFMSMPIVPVTSFRAPWDSTNAAEVAAIVGGASSRYDAIELVASEAAAIRAEIGIPQTHRADRVILAADAADLRHDLALHRARLGFLQLPDVDPSVRALGWDGVSLFGVHHLATIAAWRLAIQVAATPAPGPFGGYDPATAWTLIAAGDIMLDRRVGFTVNQEGRGVDFPFDGGTATIAGHTCCNDLGNAEPIGKRTGNAGAVRALVSGADLALANFENPAPNDFAYHPTGFTFSADPALLQGVKDAGFDWLSLANNHIRNYGGQGILDTIANLDALGLGHAGAGANLDAARRASFFDVGGIKVAILGYDTIRPDFAASPTRAGTNEMSPAGVKADVAAARAAGADFVIVFPHWGIEYTAQTTAKQRALAHAAVDAGADLVIGSHPHWAGGLEVYKGVPIFYCLGDFVFDIDASEQTLEGILPKLTFEGTRLVQVRMDPYLILDVSQPNLLDPAGSGAVVMKQVFGASTQLPW
jgi:poly-gamma-glutamate capsule biosynthesis protein CapA/YwtB (metallophosphatase superfamily)